MMATANHLPSAGWHLSLGITGTLTAMTSANSIPAEGRCDCNAVRDRMVRSLTMGLTERINIYTTMLWFAVLSVTLLRTRTEPTQKSTV